MQFSHGSIFTFAIVNTSKPHRNNPRELYFIKSLMFTILNFSELKKTKHDYATKLECVTVLYKTGSVFVVNRAEKKLVATRIQCLLSTHCYIRYKRRKREIILLLKILSPEGFIQILPINSTSVGEVIVCKISNRTSIESRINI